MNGLENQIPPCGSPQVQCNSQTLNDATSENAPITLAMFKFVGSSCTQRSKRSPTDIRRENFSRWVSHQFGMRYRQEPKRNQRDHSAFKLEDGMWVLELRYGTSPLKGLDSPNVVVPEDHEAFERFLLKAIREGVFDNALELSAQRVWKVKEGEKE